MKKGCVVWLCGLAGSGKSTLAKALSELLRAKFDNVIYLDGDELRELLGNFSYDKKGRVQVALWYSRLAKFLSKQGQIVIVSTISLFNEVYEFNRKNLQNYYEIFVECDFDELKKRDQKGLYTRALSGLEKNVVGVDIAYDTPKPHFIIDNSKANELYKKSELIFAKFMNFYSKKI